MNNLSFKQDLFSAVSHEGIIIHQLGFITEVNNTLIRLLGIEEKESIISHHITEFFDAESQTVIVEHINNKSEITYEVKRTLGNEIFYFEICSKNIIHNGHEYQSVLLRDITKRVIANQKIDRKNQLLDNLINNLPGIIFQCLLDENWTMIKISNQCERITGYSAHEFIQNKSIAYADLITPEENKLIESAILGSIEKNERYEIEYKIKTKSGKIKWVWEQGVVVMRDGKPHHIEGYITDITARREAQDELKNFNLKLQEEVNKKTKTLSETNEELRQQTEEINANLAYIEEINQNINEKNARIEQTNEELNATQKAIDASAIVSFTDLKGNILEVNSKFCEVSQYTREELIGQNQNIVSSHSHSREFWIDMWQTIAKGKVWRGEIKNKKKDGEYYWVDTVISPFLDNKGRPYKYMAIRFLITDKKIIEEELRQQAEEINTNLAYIEEINQNINEKNSRIEESNKELHLLNGELNATQNAIDASAIVSVTDLKGNILEVNNKFCEISQYSREELIGENQNIVSSHSHSREFWMEMWQTIAKGKVWRGEIKNKKKNGEYYWVDTVISPFLDNKGRPHKYMAIRFLITDKKIIEEELKETNLNITKSIEYAKNIQHAMFPSEEAIRKHFSDSFILFEPKDIVSGDFVWFWNDANSNKSYLAAVDCTGHGVPGAFMSLLGYELLDHIIISRRIFRPDIVLEEKDKAVRRLLDQDKQGGNNDGMDMSLIEIDHDTSMMRYSGAYNGIFIIRNGELIDIRPTKVSIGSNLYGDEKTFQLEKIQLEKNDCIYLYSDGYPDQLGGEFQKKFMKGAFKKLLLEISPLPMSEQKKILWDTHQEWKNGFFQVDDITVVGLKF